MFKQIIYDFFFLWIYQILIKNSSNKEINIKDIKHIPNKLTSKNCLIDFEQYELNNKNNKKLLFSIIYMNIFSIILILLSTIIHVFINFYKISLYQQIIFLFSSKEESNFKNKIILFIFIEILSILLMKKNNYYIKKISNKVQIQLMNILYKKLLSKNSDNDISEGNIINLIQINSNAFYDFLSLCNNIIIIPLQLVYNIYYLYNSFKLCFIPSILIVGILSFNLNSKKKEIIKKEYNLYLLKDSYLKLITQTFNSIQNIKLLSYEKFIYVKVNKKKKEEINIQKEIFDFYIIQDLFYYFSNIIMSFFTIISYHLIYKNINNLLMINSFYFFNNITGIIVSFPEIIQGSFNIFIPFERIEKFIRENEENNNSRNYKQTFNEEDKKSILIKNTDFGIIKNTKKIILLSNINLQINKGEFIGIIGDISSGKSNFLKSLINNLNIFPKNKNDKIYINGKISYVSQIPFLINDTIRNNILFFNEMDYEKYETILDLCELKEDINLMEKKDFTIIKEKGVNLSSGQKTRINIARALYNCSDIYLFDDPLNSLDNIIANKIFNNIFLNYLKGKTIIFVTHHIEFIKKMNRVIFFNHGYIEFDGSIQDFLQNERFKNYKFNFINNDNNLFSLDNIYQDYDKNKIYYNNKEEKKNDINYIDNKINFQIMFKYFSFYGKFFIILMLILKISIKLLNIGEEYYINYWSYLNEISIRENYKYLFINIIISIMLMFLILVFSKYILNGKIRYIINIHNSILKNLLNAPINLFHDITLRGELLNRITNELNQSINLIDIYSNSFDIILNIIILIIMTIRTSVYLLLLIPIILFLNWKIFKIYFYPGNKFIILEQKIKTKITSNINETLIGFSIIKAYNSENNCLEKFQEKIDDYFNVKIVQICSEFWFKLLIELISDNFFFCVLLICYFFRNSIPSYIITLLLSYSQNFINYIFSFLMNIIRISYEEKNFKRCLDYTNIIQEINLEMDSDNNSKEKLFSKGKICFYNLSIKYRPNSPLILSNINLLIKPNEKIGIVGRTGSGKSTLCLSLFRIIESFKGKILIDDINIKDINLEKLRKNLSIISQESFLIDGNLRDNIDPYNLYSDEEIMKILNKFQNKNLKDKFELKQNNLSDLSIGEKQLICICRVLLNKNKIIIMDEVTSNMDYKNELFIQNIIEKEFKNNTVLMVSHRVNFLIKCNKIIVFSKGKIAQFDTPENLIKDKNGIFYKLYSLSINQ